MKKIAFRNLGCKVNEYELEYMQQEMVKRGYKIVPFDAKSDIYVINTCTVTNIADRKSRQMLHKAKKQNPEAIVVAVGCYVQTDEAKARNDEAVDIVIGNNKKADLPDIIEEYMNTHALKEDTVLDLTHDVPYEDMLIERCEDRTRAFVKIQDGCNQFCSYCAIPLSRGRIRSRKLQDILEEVSLLSKNGYKEIVLTGIHLSSYGLDFHPDNGRVKSYNEAAADGGYTNNDLIEVIEKCADIDGIKRIRLGSLEPRLVTEEFLKAISRCQKICPHFHLSLQSGCDETLKRMNRKYTCGEFRDSINKIRQYFDNPAISTDVIVGFPGETEAEFEKTYEFLKEIKFYEMHVFKYSRRKNTVADKLPNQVSEEDKDIRSEKLLKLNKEISDEFRQSYESRTVEVLFEEEKNGYFTGHTREYIKVKMKSSQNLKGQIMSLCKDVDTLSFEDK